MSEIKNKRYLIIPPMPTPNGGFHLGHIGGPYLGADILARYLRLTGNKVVMLSGSDCYESFVELQAETEKKSIHQICEHYHDVIAKDLADMQIHLDKFINPLDPDCSGVFRAWHERIFNQLRNKQVVSKRNESMLWDEIMQRYVTGCWLDGECPYCQAEIRGYFCDECGGHFRPEQISHAYNFPSHETENLFLNIPCVFDLARKGINHEIQTNYRNFLRRQNGMIRLSTNGAWGMKCETGETFFSYSFIYAYYLCLGEIAADIFGMDNNAFAADSGVVTIASFGVDNAVPVLASVLGISANCPDFKPLDYYLVNYFYYLNDTKFSTSRRNAVWVSDIIHKAQAASDIVRLYLASIDIRSQHNNFDANNFMEKYNHTVNWIIQRILKPLEILSAPGVADCDTKVKQQLENALTELSVALKPDQFLPHAGVNVIQDWLDFGDEIKPAANDYFWWLKGLAILMQPFMPQLSQRLWIALGYRDEPAASDFLSLPVSSLKKKISINIKLMNENLLQQCIDGVVNDAR